MPDIARLPRTTTPLVDIPFIYESYRDLTSGLGAVDGRAASLAIAARYFTEHSRGQADEQALGLSLASSYGVSTRYIDLDHLPAHLHQLLIVGTTKQWEDFLVRFRREQVALGRVWRDRTDGEDRLAYTLDNLESGKAANIRRIGEERYALIQYYRLVRNAAAHEFERRARLEQEYAKVEQYRTLVASEYGLDAPNSFEDTKFDDHMLYTRVTKYVATDLCRLTPPRSFLELHKVLTDRANFSHDPVFIHSKKGNDAGLAKALVGFLRQHYNYHLDEYPLLLEELLGWINSIPNRKARRRNRLGSLSVQLAASPTVDADVT